MVVNSLQAYEHRDVGGTQEHDQDRPAAAAVDVHVNDVHGEQPRKHDARHDGIGDDS